MRTGTSRGRRGRCALERRGGATQPLTSSAPPRLTARLAKATPDPERLACGRGKKSLTSTGPLRKRHVLTCSFGFLLAVFVSAASLHDTHGLAPLLEQAEATGWSLERIKVDGIYTGPTVRAAAARHDVEVQVVLRDPAIRGFAPLPLRWRIEATFGTLTNRYRRLTRNLEQSADAAENLIEIANLRRVLRVLTRSPQEQA